MYKKIANRITLNTHHYIVTEIIYIAILFP